MTSTTEAPENDQAVAEAYYKYAADTAMRFIDLAAWFRLSPHQTMIIGSRMASAGLRAIKERDHDDAKRAANELATGLMRLFQHLDLGRIEDANKAN